MKKIRLSILMPVFNEGVNLKIMLKILKASIDFDHEILIVYDIPEDDSIPVVKFMQKNYPELRLVHNKKGRGVINAIKSGIEAAKSEGNKSALRSFTFANEVEKVHAALYQKALDNLEALEEVDYYVCSVCGYTCESGAPDTCPVCSAKKGAFSKVD